MVLEDLNQHQIRLLVCSANLGNAQPDKISLTAWIPRDGLCNEVIKPMPDYPVVMTMGEHDSKTFSLATTFSDSIALGTFGGTTESEWHSEGSSTEWSCPDEYHLIEERSSAKSTGPSSISRASFFSNSKTEPLLASNSSLSTKLTTEKRKKLAMSLATWAMQINQKMAVTGTAKISNQNADDEDDNDRGGPTPEQLQVGDQDQFDLIVIGMQEATFDPPNANKMPSPKSDDIQEDEFDDRVVDIDLPLVDPIARGARKIGKVGKKGVQAIAQLTQDRDYIKQLPGGRFQLHRRDWGGGASVLHALIDAQLPSYQRIVSYQRGQMRLEVYCHVNNVEVEVLHVEAQNTGRAGLANKGGIVAELLLNGTTRISFLTAHLEAHEGPSKYQTRCVSLADILSGTKNSKWHDISHTSHFSFIMGDLNFRTELDANLPKEAHKRAIQAMVEKKNWYGLNQVDELHRALRQKMCLVGYQTPMCNFPPTFKVERQPGFTWQEKRRPSYCDRVLFHCGDGLEQHASTLVYEPIGNFCTSDHKPVRAAFSINLNQPFRPRHKSFSRRFHHGGGDPQAIMDKIELFLSDLSVDILDKEGMAPNPYVALISSPKEALKIKSSRWKAFPVLRKVKKGEWKTRGWPTTSRKFGTFSPSWEDDELTFSVRLHHPDGTPIDLTGAILHFTVLNFNPAYPMEDSVIGTFSFNLVPLLKACRDLAERQLVETNNPANPRIFLFRATGGKGVLARFSVSRRNSYDNNTPSELRFAANASSSTEDPIKSCIIDHGLTKNGKEVGRIKGKIETWWMDSDLRAQKMGSKPVGRKKRLVVFPKAQRRSNLVSTEGSGSLT